MTYAADTTDAVREVDAHTSSSAVARQRMLSQPGEPLFFADWMRVLMIHFEVDAERLQRDVPYHLDLHEGRAFVTLVAFTMENMCPRVGGRLGAWLFKPITTHDFLNVRTYVRHNGESGIHFLAEWLSSWLAVQLGPRTFGLPYRHGRIAYQNNWRCGFLRGCVTDMRTGTAFAYQADIETEIPFSPCKRGTLDEWLMEHYTAFNSVGGRKRYFRVWHPPWPQHRVDIIVREDSLLAKNWPWIGEARLIGGNFCPGLRAVWMGRPFKAY